jgi:hypothetical protein
VIHLRSRKNGGNVNCSRRWSRTLIAAVVLCAAAETRAQDTAAPSFPAFHVGGFADIELHTTSENERQGLDLANVDIYSTLQFSNAWSALGEAVAQKNWRRDDHSTDIDLERLYVEYSTSDALRVEFGQTDTGIIRWNEREHRSRFLQTPIDVPAIARRPQEDGAWPLRFIGLIASGRVQGPLGVSWSAGVGAGPGRVRDSISIFGSDRSPAGLVSLSFAPDALPGFEAGAAVFAQHVRTEPDRIRERDMTLSANYVINGTEVRVEWARMSHRLTDQPVRYRSNGYYVLFSKRLSGRLERFRPYLLLDRLNVANQETYLADATDENAWAAGVRCDITKRFTIKGEYRSQRAINGDRETVAGLQLGFSF